MESQELWTTELTVQAEYLNIVASDFDARPNAVLALSKRYPMRQMMI